MPEIDLNLLTALDALLAECSVTRAAQRLGLSTSAMSRTLTRLRHVTGDPLLVQAGRYMVPTPYAAKLAENVSQTVFSARTLLQPPGEAINLATTERSVVIRANEGFIDLCAAPLLQEMRQVAPNMQLLFASKSDKDVQALREGKIDLEIGVLGTNAPELKTRLLFSDRFVGICQKDHPLLQEPGITPERYIRFPHVVVSRKNKQWGPVDTALDVLGLRRKIVMSVPSYGCAINLIRHSDAIGLVPFTVLAWSDPCAEINYFELPVPTPPIKVSAIWHPRMHADPVHQWVRETIVKVSRSEFSRHTRAVLEKANVK